MGQEFHCAARIAGRLTEGTALLESTELIFRGEPRLKIPLAEVREVRVEGDALRVRYAGGDASFELGAARAKKWCEKIRSPPTVMDKLGVKAGQSVGLVGRADTALGDALRARGAVVREGALETDTDVIFLLADTREVLSQLATLVRSLKRDGAIWIVRPRGTDAIGEADVLERGRAAGLKDVKVVALSETHSAAKFVIPLAQR